MAVLLTVGALFLLWFFLHIRARERSGKEPLLSTGLFKNRACNLALVTQNLQWLIMMGTSFVISVYLQEVHGYSPIKTGLIFTSATAGILISSFAARGMAKRYSQRALIAALSRRSSRPGLAIRRRHVRAHRRVPAGAVPVRTRRRRDADTVRERPSSRASPRSNKARSRTFPERSNSARRSAPLSPARSLSPPSPSNQVVRRRDDRPRRIRRRRALRRASTPHARDKRTHGCPEASNASFWAGSLRHLFL